ncbi:MAG: hypothetical protein ACLPYB_13525 [Desulfobaccales bacterium]
MTEEPKLPPEEVSEVKPKVEARLIDELQKMEYEPLLPVEKKLIGWSIAIGVLGLAFLIWISYTFFPVGH